MTAEFERAVGISVREFAVENAPNNVPQIGEFRKLTELFERCNKCCFDWRPT
ncbi:MAG: hypothetical protein M3530_08810 [Thermoproteota archaeon]|nr:hypothetical protein [Thermoproteota archaeon]